MNKGFYIVLEGAQGTGKTAQIELLSKYLIDNGHSVRMFREPDNQHHFTARALRRITQDPQYPLNTKAEVLLYNAARALSLDNIRDAVKSGVICIADRNFLTTLAIQYYARGDVADYETINDIIEFSIGDMEPDLTLVLDAPSKELARRTQKRGQGERFDNLDVDFIEKIRKGYLTETKKRQYSLINADRPRSDVFFDIKAKIDELIEGKYVYSKAIYTNSRVTSKKLSNESEYITKASGASMATEQGKARLESIVSNIDSDVYSFNGELDQVAVAAAMARLSRRGDDMRVTLLDEFVDKEGKDEGLIHRVVTAYGDDSVQQLVGVHLVVENASNLLTKQIEWGRLAAYLEQSTRYIYYDQKDADDNYKYYVPDTFDESLKQAYTKTMDMIFDNYSVAVHKITDYLTKNDNTPDKERDFAWKSAIRAQACDAARHMLPLATKSTVGIFASGQALESLIMRLISEESAEANRCGQQLLKEGRKVIPAFLERADKPERGGATIAYKANTKKAIKEMTYDLFSDMPDIGESIEPVTLTDYNPRNELDITPYMLYEHSNLSEEHLVEKVNLLPYDKKVDIYNTYVGERLNRRHRPGRALERITYSWDIICDYGIFRDLQRHRMVSDLTWQQLTPSYEYETPELIEKANVVKVFDDNFELSKRLHNLLTVEGKQVESQYATLMGHKMRWKVTMNAREAMHFIELRTAPQGHPGYRKLVKQMYDKLAEVHPITAAAIQFVNKDEDPELTRLAAERYTQYKLNHIK